MRELKEGVQLASVFGPEDSSGEAVCMTIGVSPTQYREIVVVEQQGQMGMVPWAKGVRYDGTVRLANLALMETVTLLHKETAHD